jgi:hypothetical protein
MHEKDQLDLLIDSALATYANPPSGLEQRVLNALAAERRASPAKSMLVAFPIRRWMPWATGLAAACVVLVLFVHHYGSHPGTQARNESSPQPQQPIARPGIAATRPPHVAFAGTKKWRATHLTPVAQAAAVPKLDVFPTPQPLTPEEQALYVYAGRSPKPVLEALARAQAQDEQSFPVATAHIPPLQPPDEGKN